MTHASYDVIVSVLLTSTVRSMDVLCLSCEVCRFECYCLCFGYSSFACLIQCNIKLPQRLQIAVNHNYCVLAGEFLSLLQGGLFLNSLFILMVLKVYKIQFITCIKRKKVNLKVIYSLNFCIHPFLKKDSSYLNHMNFHFSFINFLSLDVLT